MIKDITIEIPLDLLEALIDACELAEHLFLLHQPEIETIWNDEMVSALNARRKAKQLLKDMEDE